MNRLPLLLLPCLVLSLRAQSTPPPAPAPAPAVPITPAAPAAPAAPAPATPATPPASEVPYAAPRLNALNNAKWPKTHSVFVSKNFDAILSVDRVLSIQPKVDGKPVGAPVVMNFSLHYYNGLHYFYPKMTAIERQSPPTMQPTRVEFLCAYDRKEKVSMRIIFSDIGIHFSGDVRDPAKLQYPSYITYSLLFGASHQIPLERPIEEMQKQTEGFTVKFYDPKRVGKVHGYWEGIASKSNVAEAQVIGPWGQRRLSIEMPATKETAGQFGVFYNYQVARFFRGGWSFYRRGTDKIVPGPLTLRVD